MEEKYTKDHEWIQLSKDGKTGRPLPLPLLSFRLLSLEAETAAAFVHHTDSLQLPRPSRRKT
jgi:hypothetical protein